MTPMSARVALLVILCTAGATAESPGVAPPNDGRLRTYYIAADEVVWDYAPSGTNLAEGRAFNDVEKPWMEAGPNLAERKAKKAIYREYTDGTFTTLKPRAPEWEHLGFLGPLVRAEVGDTIKIVFRNNAKFAAAVHPHGVFYNKEKVSSPPKTLDEFEQSLTEAKQEGDIPIQFMPSPPICMDIWVGRSGMSVASE